MKAFILAAGVGSRLKALTYDKPKALVKFNNKTMLELLLDKLKSQGINNIVINIHHKGEMIIDYLKANNNFGLDIQISDERDELMNTGGALLKARNLLQGREPVLIHNVDIISATNIDNLYGYHSCKKSMATLCVKERETSRYLMFDSDLQLKGWQNKKTGEQRFVNSVHKINYTLAYSGIYIIEPGFVDLIKQTGSFSIIESWLDIATNNRITGYIDPGEYWFDLGTKDRIDNAQNFIGKWNPS